MKKINSVHLEGMVESCQGVGSVMGKTAFRLSIVTLAPKEKRFPAQVVQEYEKTRHSVRVVADEKSVERLRALERELKVERASGNVELAIPHPCIVDGMLRSLNGENFVDVPGDGFSLTEKTRIKGNNIVRIGGKVTDVSYTDESVLISVSTDETVVTSHFTRRFNQAGWDAVASRKIAKGDAVLLSGPMLNMTFTDGKKNFKRTMVSPHLMQKQELRKEVKSGPSL